METRTMVDLNNCGVDDEEDKEEEGEEEKSEEEGGEGGGGGGEGGGGSRDELKRDSWVTKLEKTQIRER